MPKKKPMPMTKRPLAVSLPADRLNVCVGIDTYSIILAGSQTNDACALIDMLIPPGGGPMPHAHECEESFYVMEGEVAVFCHDKRTRAIAGSAVNIPGWAPHVFKNLTTVPARLMCIVARAGLEQAFLEIGARVATRTSPPPPLSPKQKAELQKNLPQIVKRFNTRLLQPDTFNHLITTAELKQVKVAEAQ